MIFSISQVVSMYDAWPFLASDSNTLNFLLESCPTHVATFRNAAVLTMCSTSSFNYSCKPKSLYYRVVIYASPTPTHVC